MEIISVDSLAEISAIQQKIVDGDFDPDFDFVQAQPSNIGNDRISIEGPAFRLRDTKIVVAFGIYENFDPDAEDPADAYEADWSATLLYKAVGEPNWDTPLYYEQGATVAGAIHNYLHYLSASAENQQTAEYQILQKEVA